MFAYMLSAVAASGYANTNQLPNILPTAPLSQTYNFQQQQEHLQNQSLSNNTKNLNETKLTVNTELASHLNIKTPSPNTSTSSVSSSSSSSSSLNHENDIIKIAQYQNHSTGFLPVNNLCIPSTSSPNFYLNLKPFDNNTGIYETQTNGLLSKSAQINCPANKNNNISFKSPAFGLANIENSDRSCLSSDETSFTS